MKVCLIGYGNMGKIIAEMLGDELACVVAPEATYKKISEVKEEFDVIVDFSHPDNLEMIITYAKENYKPVVFATTGYSDEDIVDIKELARHVPVLLSSNFSLGVILMNRLIKQITPILKDDFDIEIIEAHHHFKVDAPSGTAKMLLKSAQESTGYSACYGRKGVCPRKANEIGVHAVRGGTIAGEHEVIYCGSDEIISLKHSAHSKKIFAVGAVKAARFLIVNGEGLYDMEDVLFD